MTTPKNKKAIDQAEFDRLKKLNQEVSESARFALEQENRRKALLNETVDEFENKPIDHSTDLPFNVKLIPTKSEDDQFLWDTYKTQFNKDPIIKPDGSRLFSFESKAQAMAFFLECANKGRPFFCMEEGAGVEGHHYFSCGNGQLYQGSLQAILADLKKALLASPDNASLQEGIERSSSYLPNPATVFRYELNQKKSADAAPSPSAKPSQQKN